MKDNKSKSIIFAFSIVALLMLSSIVSFGMSADKVSESDSIRVTNFNQKGVVSCVKIVSRSVQTSKIISKNAKLQALDDPSLGDSNNIVVSNATGNESYPSMVVSGYNALVAYEYEMENETHIYLRKSGDYGQSWSDAAKIEVDLYNTYFDINTTSPSLCLKPKSKQAYGTYISPYNNSGLYGYLEIGDVGGNLNDIVVGAIDWSYWQNQSSGEIFSWFNFSSPDVIYNDNSAVPWIIAFIGSTNYTDVTEGVQPVDNSIIFNWRDYRYPDTYWIQWDPGMGNCSNLSLDVDSTSKKFFGICEIKNESNQDLLFVSGQYKIGSGGDPFLDLQYQIFTGPEELVHPQIFVKGDQIYIVAEKDSQEIILFNSSNGGDSWTINSITSDILPPGSNPKYPLLNANETQLSCVYTESGNISMTNSNNNGLDWGGPSQLNSQNDSVVEEYRYADVPDMDHVLWTDNREGNNDLYSFIRAPAEINLMVVPGSVNLTSEGIPFILMKNRIKFTVKNTGIGYVEDVWVNVTVRCSGKENQTTEYPAYISYLDGNGAEKSFNKPLFRLTLAELLRALKDFAGIQYITVTVDPEGKYKDSNPLDNSVTIPTSYAEIFQKLAFLEGFFSK